MVDKLKVVLISSGVLPVPCPGYGGLEMVVYDLAVELQKAGHEVHVVAPSESKLPDGIKLIDCGPCNPNAHEWEAKAYEKYRPMMEAEEFKGTMWHDHTWGKWAYMAKKENPKLNVCSTLHGMLPYHSAPPVERPNIIGISKRHADLISAGLGIPVRYCYNGIDLTKYKMNGAERNNRLLFLARITAFKGAHTFVDLVRQLQAEGDLVGDDTLVEDRGYVERILMACNSNPKLRYWGGVARDRAVEFFQHAKAYILPCNPGWEEPFGLTVIEAQACGCPVIATASGAIPELIEEGVTGYVSKSLQDLAACLTDDKIQAISPEACRKNAERFSREAMAKGYEKLYEEVLSGGW
jgi:glycosyltransferase involved in cell wall biosynthesis